MNKIIDGLKENKLYLVVLASVFVSNVMGLYTGYCRGKASIDVEELINTCGEIGAKACRDTLKEALDDTVADKITSYLDAHPHAVSDHFYDHAAIVELLNSNR